MGILSKCNFHVWQDRFRGESGLFGKLLEKQNKMKPVDGIGVESRFQDRFKIGGYDVGYMEGYGGCGDIFQVVIGRKHQVFAVVFVELGQGLLDDNA
jgi:hypothetical protein